MFAPHYKCRRQVVLKSKPRAQPSDAADSDKPHTSRIHWAQLLKRVFNIDSEKCSICDGEAKIIASIEASLVIKRILIHLGLPYPEAKTLTNGPPQ